MGFFSDRYSRPGPGIPKDVPKKKGLALFFEILWRESFELFKLNLLFLLFCIPIVTIPAALTAMSRITVTMVRDQNHFLWTDFISSFKNDFKRSTIAGFLLFAVLGAMLWALWFYSFAARSNSVFYLPLVLCACTALIVFIMSFYVFPMIALIDLPLRPLLKNAFLLSFICIPQNLAAFAVSLVLLGGFILFLPLSLPAIFILIFALANFVSTFCAYAGISKYVVRDNLPVAATSEVPE